MGITGQKHNNQQTSQNEVGRGKSVSGSIKNLFRNSNNNTATSRSPSPVQSPVETPVNKIPVKKLSESPPLLSKLSMDERETSKHSTVFSGKSDTPVNGTKHPKKSSHHKTTGNENVVSRAEIKVPKLATHLASKSTERLSPHSSRSDDAASLTNLRNITSIDNMLDENFISKPSNGNTKTSMSRKNSMTKPNDEYSSLKKHTSRKLSRSSSIKSKETAATKPAAANAFDDANIIIQVGDFKVYKDGRHIHDLKISPLLKDSYVPPDDPRQQKVIGEKSKSTLFSVSGFFKPHKENPQFEAITLDDTTLANGVSLLPKQYSPLYYNTTVTNSNYKNRNVSSNSLSSTSRGSESDDPQSIIEDEKNCSSKHPKIVNPAAAVGPEELKLINTISEQIHEKFGNYLSKSNSGGEGSNLLSLSKNKPVETKKGSTFSELYGKPIAKLGHGSYGIVKLCAKLKQSRQFNYGTYSNSKKYFFAVKELKPRQNEPIDKFATRITSEFIIGLSLNRREYKSREAQNILHVFDIMHINGAFIEVMEFCPAGDLYSLLIRHSKNSSALHPLEADCFMKQLLHGVKFMHAHGVAHCDLKPENILLYPTGLLKICDFGTSCVFQTAWEKHPHSQTGAVGSEPYVAPEEFISRNDYDPRLVDSWSCGIIYCSMILGHYLWKIAIPEKDSLYKSFLEELENDEEFYVFEELRHINHEICKFRRNILYKILEPNPKKRILVDQVLSSPWMKHTRCCIPYNKVTERDTKEIREPKEGELREREKEKRERRDRDHDKERHVEKEHKKK